VNPLSLPSLPQNAAVCSDTAGERKPFSPTAILLLAASLRLLVAWYVMVQFPRGWFFSHGLVLGILARSLAAGEGLSSPFGGSTGPTALLAPGYPACMGLIFRVFGALTPAAAVAVMILQTLFSTATVLLMMRIARENFGIRAARVSGAFWAVSLPLIWMPTIFWETCLSALLLTGMFALSQYCARTPGPVPWITAGTYTGMAALMNPALLFSLLAMLAWMAFKARRVPMIGIACLAFLAVYAPWPVRNARLLHAFIPLRSTVGLELWMGNRDGATGYLDESIFPLFNHGEFQQYVALGEAAYMRRKTDLATAFVQEHPGLFLRTTSARIFRFWAGTGTEGGSLIYPMHAVLTTVLGGFGLWRMARNRQVNLAVLFLLPLFLFPLPYYITHAEFRYRLVIDPLLTLLAAYLVSGTSDRPLSIEEPA
jgi:4-amino-4-deoxy-L-arabinose transferase-like glycosyltransferase